MEYSSTIPQTPRDKSPKKSIQSWKIIFKLERMRVKNYLYYLIFKVISGKTWSILEWKFAEESMKQIGKQKPLLYSIITFQLLKMKEDPSGWQEAEYQFSKPTDWIPQRILRAALGISKGVGSSHLFKIEKILLTSSKELCGNLVLFELGVEDNTRPVTLPIFKRGYNDHGSCVPDHKKGRNNGKSRELDPPYVPLGVNLEEDIEYLEITGTSEVLHWLLKE